MPMHSKIRHMTDSGLFAYLAAAKREVRSPHLDREIVAEYRAWIIALEAEIGRREI